MEHGSRRERSVFQCVANLEHDSRSGRSVFQGVNQGINVHLIFFTFFCLLCFIYIFPGVNQGMNVHLICLTFFIWSLYLLSPRLWSRHHCPPDFFLLFLFTFPQALIKASLHTCFFFCSNSQNSCAVLHLQCVCVCVSLHTIYTKKSLYIH
jgi:hypothetical protein